MGSSFFSSSYNYSSPLLSSSPSIFLFSYYSWSLCYCHHRRVILSAELIVFWDQYLWVSRLLQTPPRVSLLNYFWRVLFFYKLGILNPKLPLNLIFVSYFSVNLNPIPSNSCCWIFWNNLVNCIFCILLELWLTLSFEDLLPYQSSIDLPNFMPFQRF